MEDVSHLSGMPFFANIICYFQYNYKVQSLLFMGWMFRGGSELLRNPAPGHYVGVIGACKFTDDAQVALIYLKHQLNAGSLMTGLIIPGKCIFPALSIWL